MKKDVFGNECEETYPMPAHGWTCFFCGETFITPGTARDHFGGDMVNVAGCQIKAGEERGLLMALRRAEDELARYRNDDSDMARENARLVSEHSAALRREEEKGYARGLADGCGDKSATEPLPELEGTFPVVLYFGPEHDRDEFAALIKEAKPGMVTRKL